MSAFVDSSSSSFSLSSLGLFCFYKTFLMPKIAIVGLGYVGLPLSLQFAKSETPVLVARGHDWLHAQAGPGQVQ